MRHLKRGLKLGHNSEHGRAILRNLATSLFLHGRVRTTHAKARALRPYAEHLVSLAKRGDLHARRIAASRLYDKDAVRRLFGEVAERFKNREGGYLRIVKEGFRPGDNAPVSIVELIGEAPKTVAVKEKAEAAEE